MDVRNQNRRRPLRTRMNLLWNELFRKESASSFFAKGLHAVRHALRAHYKRCARACARAWRERDRESARSEISIRMLIGMKSFTHTDLVEYQEDVVERDRADEV